MEKRNLRVVKWIGTVPAVAVCTRCSINFKAPVESLKRTGDAQGSLQKQFDQHECKPLDSSQNALRVVRESTEDK